MPLCIERVALWLAGLSLTMVVWPVVLLCTLADALVNIDVKVEDI